MENEILISVVVPVKNGYNSIKDCLEGILKQTLIYRTEIIVVDSGSTDCTAEILKCYPEVKVFEIAPEDFNHGLTRNYGVSLAKGDFVVMTVQDAKPVDNTWLEKMLLHFDDPDVAGVCGLQIVPHHLDKNPHEWFRPVSVPNAKVVQFLSAQQFDCLSPDKKKDFCSWDDVNAMYRRSVLLGYPFQNVTFGEDMLWAKSALRAGFKLIYEPRARVEHYHEVNFDFQYRRTLTVLFFRYKFFGVVNITRFNILDFTKIIYRNFKYKAPIFWIKYNFSLLFSTMKAQNDFNKALNYGEDCLENLHNTFCSIAPQASRKSNAGWK